MTISLTISTQRIRESRTNAESIQRISSSITARDDDLLTALYSPLALNMCLLSISLTWRHTKNPTELTQRSMPQKCKHLSKQRRKRRKQRKPFHKTWIQVCSDFQSPGLPRTYVIFTFAYKWMQIEAPTIYWAVLSWGVGWPQSTYLKASHLNQIPITSNDMLLCTSRSRLKLLWLSSSMQTI